MKFKIDHDYHIHSFLSGCSSDPEQNKDHILKCAIENGLSSICITDHHWDSDVKGVIDFEWYRGTGFDHISKIKPLPQAEGIEFLFGCEGDMDMNLTLGISEKRFDEYDFIVIAINHLHMVGFTVSEENACKPEVVSKLWVSRFDALLNMPLPFGKVGVAHLACELLNNRSHEHFLRSLELIPNDEMEYLFKKAARVGCAIELNQSDMTFAEEEKDIILRPFRIAKKCGCKFYLGSDAHHPDKFKKSLEVFGNAVDLLGLTEDDKFHIKRV